MTKREPWEIVGGLGKPSKMPGRSYGLPVENCGRGAVLARDPLSPCAHCYASGGFYHANEQTVRVAQRRRLRSLSDLRWTRAMVMLLEGQHWFRWHDSGDLQGVWHLENIAEVARQTPKTCHWLPTHEREIVAKFIREHNIPSNLCVRVSGDVIGRPAARLAGLPTSTVHRGHGNRWRVVKRGIECKAYTRGNQCGKCRACWDSRVVNVSYPAHGFRAARLQLPLFDAADS